MMYPASGLISSESQEAGCQLLVIPDRVVNGLRKVGSLGAGESCQTYPAPQ